MRSKKLATKAVALKTCETLHKAGEYVGVLNYP